MDVSTEEGKTAETWVNRSLGIPTVPESRRAHYPFSRTRALTFRLKLAVVLLHAGVALWRVEEPCFRFSLLLNGWLLAVTCEAVFNNYPWREPLTIWMWKLYSVVPCSGMLLSSCIALLLLFALHFGSGCELAHPWAAVTVSWICCMLVWPGVRERWHREERTKDDYDQFSCKRPFMLTVPFTYKVVFAGLQSPSFLAYLVVSAGPLAAALLLRGWIADVWAVCAGAFVLACFCVLCCLRLPMDFRRTLNAWEAEDADYARRIDSYFSCVNGNLLTLGTPLKGALRFDQLAIQVPLLLREVDILRNASTPIDERRTYQLTMSTTREKVVEFRGILENYGPYTTECCVS